MSRLAALASILQFFVLATALPPQPQVPLVSSNLNHGILPAARHDRKLHGRFLQITDIHPDPFYKVNSDTNGASACHRNTGPAGIYGAETSDCDSPFSLVNETFQWIDENLKDSIDFIVWTGDSARHDNDEEFPRSDEQVVGLNNMLVDKFREVFGHAHSPYTKDFVVPIVPTFGNNDILPHNIFTKGPNEWTRTYAQVWKDFIPEEQRHQFDRGGWFYVEVIPNKLAVFSLNTMYFFDSNSAVDGCSNRKEPGYEQMNWLRIQLEFLRQRGMKAILSGHVPPARNEAKYSWDETCWQKYALWMRQYRDVVVGSLYGHMNVDHFMLQDFEDISIEALDGVVSTESIAEVFNDRDMSITSTASYLEGLRKAWSRLPSAPASTYKKGKGNNDKRDEEAYYRRIGGEWAERFHVVHVSPSVIPNYFPTLRVFHYNITGLESAESLSAPHDAPALTLDQLALEEWDEEENENESEEVFRIDWENPDFTSERRKKKQKKKKPKFTTPKPPSKSSPPGPAYSPQTLSILGYTQYFANLTYIQNDSSFTSSVETDLFEGTFSSRSQDVWREGKHHDKEPKQPRPPHPLRKFDYKVEYDTMNSTDEFGMANGFFARDWLALATKIGKYKPSSLAASSRLEADVDALDGIVPEGPDDGTGFEEERHRSGSKRSWFTFVQRAFVGSKSMDELEGHFGDSTA